MAHTRVRFGIYQAGEILGESDLEDTDWGMLVASGRFIPTSAYERVRAIFRGHAEAYADDRHPDEARLRRLWAERDALRLHLRDGAGVPVVTDWIQIYDYGAEAGEEDGYLVEVKLLDRAEWTARNPGAPAI